MSVLENSKEERKKRPMAKNEMTAAIRNGKEEGVMMKGALTKHRLHKSKRDKVDI